MNLIIQNNTTFKFVETTDSFERLPVGNYLLKYSELNGFFLERKEDFTLPKKLYGDFSFIKRWKTAFENTTKNVGILLSGYKGTGKTITAELFCQLMEVPVIFITSPYSGPEFESFITSPLLNGSIIFIDEYEKHYNYSNENENVLLSIMDGMYNTHLIFLLTVNDYFQVTDKLKNRLGRIKYSKLYASLDESVIKDIIADKLKDKKYEAELLSAIEFIPSLSIDILVELINDINLFDESAKECLKHLNLVGESSYYEVTAICDDKRFSCESVELNFPEDPFYVYLMGTSDEEAGLISTKLSRKKINPSSLPYKKIKKGYIIKFSDEIEIELIRKYEKFSLLF